MSIQSSYFFLDDERIPHDVMWDVLQSKYNSNIIKQSGVHDLYHRENLKWVVFKDPHQFITEVISKLQMLYIQDTQSPPLILSLDHDIAWIQNEQEITGYIVIKQLVDKILELELPNEFIVNQINILVHSKNPIGATNIIKYWESFIQHLVKS